MDGGRELGGTPLVRLAALIPGRVLYAKVEQMLPTGSAYDRIAGPLLDAEPKADPAVVAGSGSLCLAFAAAAARRGRAVTLFCPDSTLYEHRKLLEEYPFAVVLSPGGLEGAHQAAVASGGTLVHGPLAPEAAARCFERTLGAELVADLSGAALEPDVVLAPWGSGALLSGVSAALRARWPALRTVPVCSADTGAIDGVVPPDGVPGSVAVSAAEAFAWRRLLATREGLLTGYGAAAAVAAAARLLEGGERSLPLVILVDAGDRYFSRDAALAEARA